MTTTTTAPRTEAETLYARRWWALAVLCLSLLIVFVGNSSLNVTLPKLSTDLHATESQLQWVVASYSLVFAGLLFTTGALGDRYGRKGALQLGLLLFLVGAGPRVDVDVDGPADRLPVRDGRGGRADHARDAFDHRQHLPRARAAESHRDLGQRHRRGAARSGPLRAATSSATSGSGRCSS